MLTPFPLLGILLWLAATNAHIAAFHDGMYCAYGNVPGFLNPNAADMVEPLYQLKLEDWWFHHITRCDDFPPPADVYLDLPAGGSFTVELATNRGKTSLSFEGKYATEWPDGGHYPEDYNVPTCITSPNMHTQNQSMAAGTAFAISYQSDIKQVTAESLVVFSVLSHSPWKRVATYQVPAKMPPCPEGGCTCAWGWIPDGCGTSNLYHQPFKCRVTNSTSTVPVAPGKPPVWCQENPDGCVKGAKQMLYWHMLSGNNIEVEGVDSAGNRKSPSYGPNTGFQDGAQDDIFLLPNKRSNEESTESTERNNHGSSSHHKRNLRLGRAVKRW